MRDIDEVLAAYGIDTALAGNNYGNGHINDTILVGNKYILQRINTNIFKNVEGLMNNIIAVTEHLRVLAQNPDREVLRVVPTKDNKTYYIDSLGNAWRVYYFIKNSFSLEIAQTEDEMYNCGFAFGDFQKKLSNLDASKLVETIPDFHNTAKRLETFKAALARDAFGRASGVKDEIAFVLAREKFINDTMAVYASLPLRVTHNDTKINNVLLDNDTHKPLCVVDLDTVMPGYAANDFGDAVRFGTNTAAEDEKDLTKVHFNKKLYDAFYNGFVASCGDAFEQAELDSFKLGAVLMTLEVGMRFLTDYLEGDVYFKTAYPEHNLVRCHTQLRIAEEMEQQLF